MAKKNSRFLIIISDFDISSLMFNIIRSFQVAQIDFELVFISDKKTWLIEELEKIGIKGNRLSRPSRIEIPIFIFRILLVIFRGRIKGIYLSGQIACLIGLVASFVARVPKRIFTRHHSDSNYPVNSKSLSLMRANLFDKFCNRVATKIVAVSPLVSELLITNENANPKKVVTIDNSISMIPQERVLRIRNSEPFTIGVISRMTEIKGIEYVAEAFCKLYEKNSKYNLMIVGEASDSTDKILKILRDIPKDKFKIIPKIYDVSTFYSSIDVFVHVPIRQDAEAFGLVYLEAIFSGVPCVFTESGILKKNADLKRFFKAVDYMSVQEIQTAIEEVMNGDYETRVLPLHLVNHFSTNRMIDSYTALWIEP